jgi:stage V sporulation protein R
VTYCDHHSGTLATAPGQINPYKLGVELMRHIEDRWDKGQFGLEWASIEDPQERRNYDNGAMQRGSRRSSRSASTTTTLRSSISSSTRSSPRTRSSTSTDIDQRTGEYVIVDRDYRKVKQQLLWSLTNFGQPRISVIDANYANRGELYLYHEWNGLDLQFQFANETLKNLFTLWGRPVHIETREEGEGRLISFDGETLEFRPMQPSEEAFAVGQVLEEGEAEQA